MENENTSYRIRTEVGDNNPNVVNVKLKQSFDFLNILSLKIGQKQLYKMPASRYGVICGRVLLGGKSFGIQNAKVSVFIPKDNTVFDVKDDILYAYSSVNSSNYDGVRYNLLPSHVDSECHQDVGTMFTKEYVLDNNDIIRIFDKYYTYTTTTNNAGDYFIYGVPVGQHTLHVDVDLSDIGILSVRPRDMMWQGYDIGQFENPNKFKADKNLNILPQIKTQNKPIYVYPFWGDTTEDETNALITRADIEVDYKYEPSAIFIGSIISDKGANSISHKCVPDDKTGKMSELTTGEGKIEMIRKTFDGKVEQFSVKGNRVIDGDGVWCYQVPMNLDYVVMDEFGNIVPTDNPEKGIPTRARVRFRVSLDEDLMDDSARKRARFLIPNNPRLIDDYPEFEETHEADYEFGTFTKEESYRDMFWNNVYTVKSYIPRLQKRTTVKPKKYTGIKMTNHAGDNSPFPFNNLSIRMGFVYRFLCVLISMFIYVVYGINTVMAVLGNLLVVIGKALGEIGLTGAKCSCYKAASSMLITFNDLCDDGNQPTIYVPGPGLVKTFINSMKSYCNSNDSCFSSDKEDGANKCEIYKIAENDTDRLINCIQNELAQNNEVTSFDFQNDWVNGVLYAPLWYRKIKPKRRLLFGLLKTTGKDEWCDGSSRKMAGMGRFLNRGLKLYQTCAQQRQLSADRTKMIPLNYSNQILNPSSDCGEFKCQKKALSMITVDKGIVIRKETKYGEYVYYYKSVEYSDNKFKNIIDGNNGEVKILFATDLVLLGSLNNCDIKGIPQFFKHLSETTYNMPPDLLSISWDVDDEKSRMGSDGEVIESVIGNTVHSEYSGADWGNAGFDQWYKKDKNVKNEGEYIKDGGDNHDNGGLFYGITCNTTSVKPKSCINLSRVCEFGVSLDQSISFADQNDQETVMSPDGYISYDEIFNSDARSMFATMNGNRLREKTDPKTGFPMYDFTYMYPDNFDGVLYNIMNEVNYHPGVTDNGFPDNSLQSVTYRKNYRLEYSSDAYLRFRYGYDREKFVVSFYNDRRRLGIFSGSGIKENNLRFPRYENSFYFYFGLKPGKTAIEKFRSSFYSDCANDPEAESTISIGYTPNTWCNDSETNSTLRDGYISFDLSNVELPCAISLDNRDSNTDVVYTDIHSNKLYIGAANATLNGKGFERLYVDDENKQKPNGRFVRLSDYHAPTIKNGYYTILITDANGEQYKQNISFEGEKLKFDATATSFVFTADELSEMFPPMDGKTTVQRIAEDREPSSDESGYKRKIGGYITISSVMDNGTVLDDNLVVTVSNNNIPGYDGSVLKIVNGQVYIDGIAPFSIGANEYSFGVPEPNALYNISVAEFCPLTNTVSDNVSYTSLYVSEPQEFKMFVNGVDTALLTKFNTGYYKTNGVISDPYVGYDETNGIVTNLPGSVKGWLDINNVGVTSLLEYPEEGVSLPFSGIVENTLNALSLTETETYTFTDEYIFTEEDVDKELDTYSDVPNVMDMEEHPKYIRVKVNPSDPYDNETTVYQYNSQSQQYEPKGTSDITTKEYFETGEYQAQYNVISVLNGIIQRRLDLVNAMIEAFWIYNSDEENKQVTISHQTNETPVKTLVYYIPDKSEVILRRPSSIGSTTRYTLLDKNKEENVITSFEIPTIVVNSNISKPIFYKNSDGQYKLPPYCGIMNRLNVTVPKTLTAIPFNNNNITQVMSSLPNGMDNMFGFHVIDKRPFTRFNIWTPLTRYPIYWPDVEDSVDTTVPSVVENFREGEYLYMNGCVSGYFYNAFSTSQTCEVEFAMQRMEDDVNIYTLTTVNNDGVTPDEFAVPTKRLLYNSASDINNATLDYNYFIKSSNPKEGFDSDSISTGTVNTDYRYVSYSPDTTYFTVSDSRSVFNENLLSDTTFGLPEDTVVIPGITVSPKFNGYDETVTYTVVNRVNPVFAKAYNNSPELLTDQSRVDMTYGKPLPSPQSLSIPSDATRVFFVGFSENGKYRGVSPTYEVKKPELIRSSVNGHPAFRIDFTIDDVKDYYLRKYGYQLIFTYTQTIDDETVIVEEQSPILMSSYDELPSVNGHKYTDYYVFDSINNSELSLFNIVQVFVKDVTGIRRKANITSN